MSLENKYKKGDIVELLNHPIIDSSREGYYMNTAGLIPVVGNRYYVAHDSDAESTLLIGKGYYMGIPKTFPVYISQICLYKSVNSK